MLVFCLGVLLLLTDWKSEIFTVMACLLRPLTWCYCYNLVLNAYKLWKGNCYYPYLNFCVTNKSWSWLSGLRVVDFEGRGWRYVWGTAFPSWFYQASSCSILHHHICCHPSQACLLVVFGIYSRFLSDFSSGIWSMWSHMQGIYRIGGSFFLCLIWIQWNKSSIWVLKRENDLLVNKPSPSNQHGFIRSLDNNSHRPDAAILVWWQKLFYK